MERKKKNLVISILAFFLAVCVLALVLKDAKTQKYTAKEKSFIAMGTVVTEKLYGKNDLDSAAEAIESIVAELEDEISWRKSGSPINRLNENFSVNADKEIIDVIEKCIDVYEKSDGVFDITVGKLTSLWNIGDENARVPQSEEIKSALQCVDSSKVKISNDKIEIGENQFVDLGAIGKGLACDKISEYLKTTKSDAAVVSVGGSVLLYGQSPRSDKWNVAIRDPRGESSDYVAVVSLGSSFVSTSGDYERVLESEGKSYHHILDPKTGYPAESDLISVTVVCDNGLLSDALSTACFVLGKDMGTELLEKFGAQGVFIDENKNIFVTDGLKDSFTLKNSLYKYEG